MGGAKRRVGFAAMLLGAALLVLTLLTRPTSEPRSGVAAPPPTQTAATIPTSTPTPNPFTVSTADESVTINRLWSPEPFVARAEGTTSTSGIIVAVQADGRGLPPVTLDTDGGGTFSVDIRGLQPGPQAVCVAGACQRVLVAGPSEEPRTVVEARIERSIAAVAERFDLDALVPGWTIEIVGTNTSVGGSADPESKVIRINANSGRSSTEYEITILHEIAHAMDVTWMNDESRAEFRLLRELDPSLPWGVVDGHALRDDRWRDAGEDFAEMFVAWALGPSYPLMTNTIAAQPTEADLLTFCRLVDAEPLDCS